MPIDLRSKNVTGKDAETALVKAHIIVNKNMVPFDDQSPLWPLVFVLEHLL